MKSANSTKVDESEDYYYYLSDLTSDLEDYYEFVFYSLNCLYQLRWGGDRQTEKLTAPINMGEDLRLKGTQEYKQIVMILKKGSLHVSP